MEEEKMNKVRENFRTLMEFFTPDEIQLAKEELEYYAKHMTPEQIKAFQAGINVIASYVSKGAETLDIRRKVGAIYAAIYDLGWINEECEHGRDGK